MALLPPHGPSPGLNACPQLPELLPPDLNPSGLHLVTRPCASLSWGPRSPFACVPGSAPSSPQLCPLILSLRPTSPQPSTAPDLPLCYIIHSGALCSWEVGWCHGTRNRLGVWKPGSSLLPATASCVTCGKLFNLSEPLYLPLKKRICPEGLLGDTYEMMCEKGLST